MSVINQMLRDLQARGEPLRMQDMDPPHTDAATASATKTTPRAMPEPAAPLSTPVLPAQVTPVMALPNDARKSKRSRLWAWGFTACAAAGVFIGLQWQETQIHNARKVRSPLGYAEFNGAIDPQAQALVPSIPVQTITPQPVQSAPHPAARAPMPSAPSVPSAPSAPSAPSKDGTVTTPLRPLSKDGTATATPPAPAREGTRTTPLLSPTTEGAATAQPPSPSRGGTESGDGVAHAPRAPSVVSPSTARVNDPDQMLARAADFIARGRNVDAAALLGKVLVAQPQHVDVRRALAALQAEAGQPEAALATLLAGADLHPARFAPMAAALQVELGDAPGALATMTRVPPDAQTPQHHALAAGIAQRSGQHQAAAAAYQRALATQTGEPTWWIGLGISLEALGQYTEARTAYERATALPNTRAELREFAAQRLRGTTTRAKISEDAHE